MRISVIGLGKLGVPYAAVLAARGHEVIGADRDSTLVEAVADGHPTVPEPGLESLLFEAGPRLTATADVRAAVRATEATVMIVPTPSEADGTFSMRHVLDAAEQAGAALREKAGYHLFVLTSTVMPGATGGTLIPALERASGRACGAGFGVCYSPAFIALGNVVDNLLRPDMILIGESDSRAGETLESIFRSVCGADVQVARMNLVNAELVKIALNTYITTKISFSNSLAELCEKIPGADVDVVTSTIGLDSRISPKYLRAALGYGGPCFPRDNGAYAALAAREGAQAYIAQATDRVNQRQASRIARMMIEDLPPGGVAAVAGLSYKPGTPVADESQGIAIAAELAASGVRVLVYDPMAMENARPLLAAGVELASSLEECASRADALAIVTAWDEFRALSPRVFARRPNRPLIIDCWRILPRDEFLEFADIAYIGVGRNGQRDQAPVLQSTARATA